MNKSHVIAGAPASRVRLIAYWIATAIIMLETAVGSEWDLARISFVREVFDRLGYPHYLLTILGVFKVFAVAAVLAPRLARVKEWAYAGLFFVYSGAAFSHFAMGEISGALGPLIFTGLTIASWALRPGSRRLDMVGSGSGFGAKGYTYAGGADQQKRGRLVRAIIYWLATTSFVFPILSGGIAYLLRVPVAFQGMIQYGYPAYFVILLGFWKVAGSVAILVPRWGLVKEWAYAGIMFDLIGAAATHAFLGNPAFHFIALSVLAAFTVISWALRPASRWAGADRVIPSLRSQPDLQGQL
jgi:hypothetical protein